MLIMFTRKQQQASPIPLLRQSRFELMPMRGVEEESLFLPQGASITIMTSPRKSNEATLDLAEYYVRLGFPVIPHVAARQVRSREHLQKLVNRLDTSRLKEVFIIGGDTTTPLGPYDSAAALIFDMVKMDNRPQRIGIAAYPEGHHLISKDALLKALQEKQPFVHYMVTQICFDPEAIRTWLLDMHGKGIHLPVYIGIPGVVKRQKLLEISLRVGVGDSVKYLRHNLGLAARLLSSGMYKPDTLVKKTAAMATDPSFGIEGFHIYTFNQCQTTERWMQKML
jgi:methylenetetrahydrofolate reductase (NADPH)